MAAAIGPIIGGLLGAGGQVGGGLLGAPKDKPGNQIVPFFDPALNPALSASITDALSLIGRGDISSEPSPIEALVGRIQALPIGNKLKRRALAAIGLIREREAAGLSDEAFSRTLKPKKRPRGLAAVGSAAGASKTRAITTDRVPYDKELRGVLNRLGLTEQDFADVLVRDRTEKERRSRIGDQLSGLNEQTVLNRARAAQTASQLLGDAAAFASSGDPQSLLQQSILDRVNRGINDQEEKFLLQAQFGGFSPGRGIEAFQRARTDAQLTALEQALAASAGLTAGLGGGLEFAQQAGGQSGNLALGAAGISAQQANAANAIRARNAQIGSQSLAQGFAGGLGSLGTALSTAVIGSQRPAAGLNSSGLSGAALSPVSNANFSVDFSAPNLRVQR